MSSNQESAGIFRFKGSEAVITGITQSALGLLDAPHGLDKGLAEAVYAFHQNSKEIKGHRIVTTLEQSKDGMIEMLVTNTDEKSGKVTYTALSVGDHTFPADYVHSATGEQTKTSDNCAQDQKGQLDYDHSETHARFIEVKHGQKIAQEIRDKFQGFEKPFIPGRQLQITDQQANEISEFMTKEIQKLPKLPGSLIGKS